MASRGEKGGRGGAGGGADGGEKGEMLAVLCSTFDYIPAKDLELGLRILGDVQSVVDCVVGGTFDLIVDSYKLEKKREGAAATGQKKVVDSEDEDDNGDRDDDSDDEDDNPGEEGSSGSDVHADDALEVQPDETKIQFNAYILTLSLSLSPY